MNEETNHIDATIADLASWREQIDAAMRILQSLREKGPIVPSAPPPGDTHRSGHLSSDTFFQMTVPDAAEKYLKIVKATKEIPEIASALLKGGLKSSSSNFSNMVRTIVSRDSRFVKVPDAGWGLAEWYPALKRADRKPKIPQEIPKQTAPGSIQESDSRTGSGLPSNPGGTAATRILEVMRAKPNEEWTASRLAEATGINKKTAQGTIFRLRHDQKITNREGGLGYVIKRT